MIRFDKTKGKINVFLYENVMYYPPTISLIQCLLNNGYRVKLVSQGGDSLPEEIRKNKNFSYRTLSIKKSKKLYERIIERRKHQDFFRAELQLVEKEDLIWTVNPLIVRSLGKELLKYGNQHIMQVLELTNDLPLFKGAKKLRFDLSKYARNASKVVVAEKNRAYIQRIEWKLKELPYIVPNKPYYYPTFTESEDLADALNKMKNETRKIVVYLGVLDPDREFASFAKAIETIKDEYCLYLFGKCSPTEKTKFDELCKRYSCINYMGFFNPPKHLNFLKYAYIALTPYMPGVVGNGFERLNALYCAPNKIYEYAGSNVPMIGTDVLGLIEPFEKYNIGICCKDLETESIVECINYVDAHHEEMIRNCSLFYDAVDLDELIIQIVQSGM